MDNYYDIINELETQVDYYRGNNAKLIELCSQIQDIAIKWYQEEPESEAIFYISYLKRLFYNNVYYEIGSICESVRPYCKYADKNKVTYLNLLGAQGLNYDVPESRDSSFLRICYLLLKNLDIISIAGETDILKNVLNGVCFDYLLNNNYIYFCWYMVNNHHIEPNIKFSFDYYNLSKQISFFQLCMKIWDMRYPENNLLLINKAILIYYLGGAPLSFLLFDEKIDDGDCSLSARDYYYYALTSKLVDVDFKSIYEDSICQIENEDDISLYYKGQILLLGGEKESALTLFNQASEFKYARIMSEFLTNGIKNLPAPTKVILNPEESGYEIFEDFYHYHECEIAFNNYFEVSSIYRYFVGNSSQIQESIKKSEADVVATRMYTDLRNRSVTLTDEEYNKRLHMLDELLLNRDGMVRRALQETDEGIQRLPDKAEVQIALTIENFEIKNIDFYALLIYYYYFKGFIDQTSVINLSFYVIAVAKQKIKDKVFDKLFDIGLSVTAVTLLCPFDFLTHFKQLCLAPPLLAVLGNQFKNDIDLLKKSRYECFIEKLKLQELELKQKLGDEVFMNECRFTTIIDKVSQIDNYFREM